MNAGFSDAAPAASAPKKRSRRVTLTKEQLEKDHGDAWESVDAVLQGKKAESPEAILRARLTALRYKDAAFLAATEVGEEDRRTRLEGWQTTLGLKEENPLDKFFGGILGGNEKYSIQNVDSFEIVSAEGDDVEFKVRCKDGKVLHEKSTFKKDSKWGYVYAGDSEFTEWS